ncbi:unnamed protein product [Leuciscus chuanchicus]
MILPLQTTVLNSMAPNEEDSPTVREIKTAITENLKNRYSACHDFLHKCTVLDPRFKALPHVDDACRDRIYNNLITEIATMEEQSEEATAVSSSPVTGHPEASSPPVKKSAMAELFGELFKTQVGNKPTLQLVKEEVTLYKAVDCISMDFNPLEWWRTNEPTYPHIAKLAKHYLAVPATSVPSERCVFAAATHTPSQKEQSVFLKMSRSFCGSCRAPLSGGDRHIICVSCLGEGHAALALADGGCPHCELLPMATLRTRLASFHETALPAVMPRHKKRRAQRVPEPPPTEKSSPVRPPALPPASPESLSPGQWPPFAAASVGDIEEEAAVIEEDSCSILASGSEDWSSSVDLAPSSAREPSGKRANIEAELTRLLTQATQSLGLEWSAPDEPARNRLDGCFLQGDRISTPLRPAPFLPELHEELAKSWSAPFSARMRSSASAAFSVVDGAKGRGYLSLPLVEDAVAAHLCPPSAGRRAKTALPSKACHTTSAMHSRA